MVEAMPVPGMCLVLDSDDDRYCAKGTKQLDLCADGLENPPVGAACPGRKQADPLSCKRGVRGQACTTFCSIAPKIEWWLASFISTRTTSPGFMKGVVGLPFAMVSIMRISAMQL